MTAKNKDCLQIKLRLQQVLALVDIRSVNVDYPLGYEESSVLRDIVLSSHGPKGCLNDLVFHFVKFLFPFPLSVSSKCFFMYVIPDRW